MSTVNHTHQYANYIQSNFCIYIIDVFDSSEEKRSGITLDAKSAKLKFVSKQLYLI